MADPQTLARMLAPPQNPAAAPQWAQQGAWDTFVQPVMDAYKAQSPQDLLAPVMGAIAPPAARLAKGLMPEAKAATQGIRAYHGSPYDFDKFDLSKIGTGEGAQSYGHGLYFAGNEKVARQYRDNLGVYPTVNKMSFNPDGTPNRAGQAAVELHVGFTPEEITQHLQVLDPKASPAQIASWIEEGQGMLRQAEKAGKMYEVNLNVSPDQLLDWDRPLREQPRMIERLNEAGFNIPKSINDLSYLQQKAAEQGPDSWYALQLNAVKDMAQRPGSEFAPKKPDVTDAMRSAGIPGIQYLDQGSRSAGEGTRNYVMFDPELIKIVRKYGLAGLTAGPALGAALSQQDGQGGN